MADQTQKTDPLATQEDVRLGRSLRNALGQKTRPGECKDCGGMGLVPSIEATAEAGRSLWRTCPTCLGHKHGGVS